MVAKLSITEYFLQIQILSEFLVDTKHHKPLQHILVHLCPRVVSEPPQSSKGFLSGASGWRHDQQEGSEDGHLGMVVKWIFRVQVLQVVADILQT